MKSLYKIFALLGLIITPIYSFAQIVPCDVTLDYTIGGAPPVALDYNMSNGSISTCSGNFFDPGGTGNYANSTGLITQTFCSDQPGEQIILDFTAFPFQVETSFDFLNIYDGVGTGGTNLWNSQTAGGAVNPGMITSTTGCLTITFSSDGSVNYGGWQATISCTNPVVPGFDCNGGDVTLTAVGQGQQTIIMSNDFNGGLGAGWVSTGGSAVGAPCGPSLDGTDYYWASTSTGTPNLTTVSYDVSCGGTLSFDMAYATQGGATPCEGPDLANEGVTLQYSTDGGATWIVIQYWDPLGGYDPTMTAWNNYSIPIPPGAMTPGTQFQWIQNNSSGTCCDNWGIDNVVITANTNCATYWYDYTTVAGTNNPPVYTTTITSTSTIGVWYTNGTDSCYASTTIVVPPGTTADAGPDQVICGGGSVTIGADPVTLDEGAVYTWSSGATGTIDLTGGGQDNGTVSVSPAVTTDYYLEVTINGCSAFDTVTVTVDAPPTASNPATINVQCAGDVPAPNANVVTDENDDITIPPAVAFVSDVSDGLSCPETITRTYRVTDGCGNFVDVVQLIVIEDTQAPVMNAPPANVTVECAGDVPAMTNLGYTDNCDAAGTVAGSDGPQVGGNCGGTITRTWTYTDACGNVATSVTQTITIQDTQAPVMAAVPANVTVQCAGDVPAMINLGYTDNCEAAGIVTGADVSDGLSCPETITRTWTYTDACGNVSTPVTQTITVHDTQAPVLTAAPAPVTVECVGDVPAMVDLGYTDNCNAPGTVTGADGALIGGPCGGTITRTWTIADACGNTSTVTQTITIDDTTPPTASNLPPMTGTPPAPNILDVFDEADNCSVPTVAFVSDVSDGGNCPEIITRTYSVTDACGNTINVTQTFTIGDAIMPTASNPAPINVECIGDVPASNPLVVTDEADNGTPPVVTWEDDTSDGLSCPETIARRYRVTDNCGNFIFVTQTITVMDVTVPVMNAPPAAVNVQCIGDVPAMIDLGYTDNCDAAGTVTGSDVSDGLTCPETITRSWVHTDVCGNVSATVTQIITVHDNIAPVLTVPLAAATFSCSANVPPMTDLGYIDNCDAPGTVTGVDVSDGLSCPETITRTWTATDNCGNTSSVQRIFTVHDLIAPVLAAAPAATTVECVGDVPAMIDLGYTDNCDAPGTVTGVDGALTGGPCGGTITRTWTITDACGNTSTVTQTITVDDTTLPTASNLPPISVTGIGAVPPSNILDVFDEADNCTVNPTVVFVSDVSDGGNCPEVITRTYSVTDDCGNTINVTQMITVGDPIAPTASNPVAVNVECIGDVPAADPLVVTDENDNGNMPVVTWEDDTSDGLSCPETIARRYRVTDDCGNFIFVTQTIVVNDVTPPTATAPATVNVECIGDVPAANILDVNDEADNCTANPVVAYVGDVSNGLSCPETITRTYSITDDCGNQITVDQLIIVNDVTPPTATAPATVNVECIGDVPAVDLLLINDEADNCTANPVVAHVGDVSDGLSCPETITRTYSITDDCGNQITVDQLIIVNDVTNPTASNPATTTVPGGPVPAIDITIVNDEADNCTANPVVAFVSEVSDNNPCPETITRIYSVTDDCGNTINVTHLIVITDPILPTGTAPANVNVECIGDVPAADPLLITDEADNQGVPTVAHVGDVSDGLSCPETITRTYSITDVCGNVVTVDQLIIVNDVTNPTASAPATVNVECIGDVPAANILDISDEADNCTANPVVVHVGDVSNGLSCPETITRTYSITDDCGNQITVDQLIIVNDVTNPTATAPATVNVECIGDVPAVDLLLINDEADNCTVNPVVAHVGDVSDGLSCPETITRTYSITDDCGNQITVDQLIIVNDVTNPTASNPATTTVPGGPAPAVDITIVNDEADNCTANPVVAFVSEVSDNNPCPETITRVYSVTDDCGNTINVTHLIVITDPIMPTATAPAAVNVECIGDVPAADVLIITDEADNQGVPIVAHVGDVSDGLSCPETITRTYSVTDICGNQITLDQIITVNDITNPTASAPATVNVECIGDVPAANVLDITDEADNCTVNPVVVHVGDVSDGLSCPETITRTYSITDDCGNQITVDQLIIVNDVTNPTATAPANVNVECIGDVPAADILAITNEADNCTLYPTVVHVGDVSDGLSCPETITRTYSITDDCGNQITVDQLIIVNDVTPPTASNVATINVPGSMDVPAPDVTVVTTEADNCTLYPVVAWVSDVSDGNVCNLEEITRTYSVTDNCGNQITVTQIIIIDAVPAPIDAGPDQLICVGASANVVATNPWNVPIVWNPLGPNGYVSPITTTVYTVTADNLGCISTDDMTVTVEELPVVSFFGDELSGCEPLTVNFTNNSSASSGLVDCEWIINGQTINDCGNITYTFDDGGTYDVMLTTTSASGCVNSALYTDYIYVEDTPIAAFSPSSNYLTTIFTEVQFENNSVGAVNYDWTFGDLTGTSNEVNPTHQYPNNEGGTYTVQLMAYSPLGCVDSAMATIAVVEELIYYIPNTFTPDGDSYNEYFLPIFTTGYDPYDFEILIYNRWGEVVWESHDVTVGWDGTYGAGQKVVQDGTYTWKIEFKTSMNDERITVSGHVNIIR